MFYVKYLIISEELFFIRCKNSLFKLIIRQQQMCGTPQARAPERGTGPMARVAVSRGMDTLNPGPRVFDIASFLGKGGLPMLCH